MFFLNNFCIQPYVSREPRRLYEHGICYIGHGTRTRTCNLFRRIITRFLHAYSIVEGMFLIEGNYLPSVGQSHWLAPVHVWVWIFKLICQTKASYPIMKHQFALLLYLCFHNLDLYTKCDVKLHSCSNARGTSPWIHWRNHINSRMNKENVSNAQNESKVREWGFS